MRRWPPRLKPAAYLAMIAAVGWCGWTTIAQHRLDCRIGEWVASANNKSLLCHDQQVCVIPRFKHNPVGRVPMARREIVAVAFEPQDVDALLSMPECPVKLTVMTLKKRLSAENLEQLRERFGSENVE